MLSNPLLYAIFWLIFAIAFGFFARRVYQLFSLVRLGGHEAGFDHWGKRLGVMIGHVLLQKCSLKSVSKKDMAGIGHAFLFWGFLLFLFYYVIYIFIGDGLGLSQVIENTTFSRYFLLIIDIAGVLVALAIIWAAIRRYIVRPQRLEHTAEATIILALIFLLMLAHFCIGGFRINVTGYSLGDWTPISLAFANLFDRLALGRGLQETLYGITWWAHYLIILGLLVFIPFSKHVHIAAAAINIFFGSLCPKGAPVPIDLEKEKTYGASRIEQFTWKQLLDLYACTECGRCQVNCPAYLTGKPLNPKQVILDMKNYLLEEGQALLKVRTAAPHQPKRALIGDVITEDVLWSCTTCGACLEHCPAFIDPLAKIIEMRRHLVLSEAIFPPELKVLFRNVMDNGNPWPKASVSRGDWATGLSLSKAPEDEANNILYWVGCVGSYDERVQRVSQSLARILRAMNINIWILGKDELCCGDSIRRAGNEYLFQKLAIENIEQLKKHGVKKIVTHCPHCFNTLKNEYPKFGGEFEVIHHTQLLSELIPRMRPRFAAQESKITVTYQDPCYLGRYNGIYKPARNILSNLPGVRIAEMGLSKKESLCCGGGGGRLWMREQFGRRISHVRIEQALMVEPDIIATACPLCLIMLEEALENAAVSHKVMDIAEIIEGSFRGDLHGR